MAELIALGIAAFVSTNIDDIFLLMMFFSDTRFKPLEVVLGQYIGMAALVISSELPELLSICDRILVLREGRISGELEGKSATQEQLLQLALPS